MRSLRSGTATRPGWSSIGASLFGAFPVAYAVFLPAFYIPVLLLLFGLIFRGVAFEFRYRQRRARTVGLGLLCRLDGRCLRPGRGGRAR